jgi:cytochrome c
MKNLTSTLLPTFLAATLLSGCGGEKTPETPTPPVPAATAQAKAPMTLEQRGARIFKRCQACHTLDEGGRNKVGPNLWGIYGADAGVHEGFAYSKAMKAAGIIWDETTMDAYLKKPAQYVPGTKMSFIGLKKQEDRDAVQAYMKSKTIPKAVTP